MMKQNGFAWKIIIRQLQTGHSLLKETEHLLKCSDARTNGDPVCRSLVILREPLEENILGLVHQYAASMLEKGKNVSSKRQCECKEINTAELQKQSRQLISERMKLYDDYKDGRMERDSHKQRAEKISVRLDEIKRKIEDAENSKKLIEQNELSDKIKLKDFLGIQKFDTEKLREIIKVVRVHSQDEIEIEWNFDDIFQNRDNLSRTRMTYQKIIKVLGLPDGSVRQSSAEKIKFFCPILDTSTYLKTYILHQMCRVRHGCESFANNHGAFKYSSYNGGLQSCR